MARFAAAMLKGGAPVLSPAGVAAMTRPRSYGDGDLRALGWDVETHYASNRGDLFPPGSYGHTGWTGTSLWIDPATRTFVIILSNRNHPDESGNVVALRGRIASIVASAITDVKVEVLREASEETTLLAAVGAARAAPGSTNAPSARASNEKEGAAAPARVVGQVRPAIDVLEENVLRGSQRPEASPC